ncbi:MAG: PH domain-containing protein [Clostridia bacterium]|nr:PH domain-containing protein [Clostridia bacterium]
MENKRFKPLIDKGFLIIWVPLIIFLAVATALSIVGTVALCIMIATDLFTLYFLVSPLFGYAELREKSLFVRFGFVLKLEIPYVTIRGYEKRRKFYSDSMLSLKLAMEHINIKYNKFDVIAVSVVTNDDFEKELSARIEAAK